MLTGAVVTYAWRQFPLLKDNLYELVPAFILAFLMVIIVSLITQPRPTQQ
jgi:Na+/proline symporter